VTPSSADALAFAPRLKIERAKHHIDDLDSKIAVFMQDRPFRLIIQHKPKAEEYIVASKRQKTIPNEWSLILGDAIHNLCAALDITLYAMAKDKAASPFEIMFPFVRKAESLEGRIKGTQVNFAGTYVVETIRALKPYPGGNEILSGLHRLDARDKHRLLILTGQVADFSGTMLQQLFSGTPGVPPIGPEQIARFLHSDAEITPFFEGHGADYRAFHAFGMSDDFEQEADVQPPYRIAFGKGQPFEFKPVIETLRACTDTVEQVVADLIEAFLSPGNIR
jgi:hypothetical protein